MPIPTTQSEDPKNPTCSSQRWLVIPQGLALLWVVAGSLYLAHLLAADLPGLVVHFILIAAGSVAMGLVAALNYWYWMLLR